MKKLLVLLIFFSPLFAEEKVILGVANPYYLNETPATLFFHKQFVFELYSGFENTNMQIEILSLENSENKEEYYMNIKNSCIDQNADFFFFPIVYSIDDQLFFRVDIVNPYNDIIVESKYFKNKVDYSINESLSDNVKILIKDINLLKLSKTIVNKQKIRSTVQNKNKLKEGFRFENKHEIFVLNGFLKNHPRIISFLSVYTGYSFTPYNFLRLEAGFFFGNGYLESSFQFNNIHFNNFYIGGYPAVYFFLGGPVEPSIGARLEFSYVFFEKAYLSIPMDISMRFYINGSHVFRISSSFQFVCFSFHDLSWQNNYTIGIMMGYAKKF